MDIRSTACALLVVVIWGLNFSVIKFGLEELPPILFSGLRFLIVALPAVLFLPLPKTSIWNVLGVGLFLGVLKFSFLFVAMKADVSAGISSLLLQAQVLFTILLSVLFLKESINKYQLTGIFVAAIGFSLFLVSASGNVTFTGIILLMCAALFWSISNIIMKKTQGVNLLHFMVWASLVPPVPLFLVSYFYESQSPINLLLNTSASTWVSLVFVGYVSTLLAFALWGWLLRNYQAAMITPFALLIPIVGMIGSNLLLGESLSTTELWGAVTVFSGLLITVFGLALISRLKQKQQNNTQSLV